MRKNIKELLKKAFIIPYVACYGFAILIGYADEMPTIKEMKILLDGGCI